MCWVDNGLTKLTEMSQINMFYSTLAVLFLIKAKTFHMVICLKIPFHPYQPTFGRDEIFFPFFVLKSCTLFY